MHKILHIENLDCPVCAEALQSDLSKIKGVERVQVDYVSQTIALEYASEDALQKVVKTANKFEEVRVLDGETTKPTGHTHQREWLQILSSALLFLSGILFGVVVGWEIPAYVCYALAYLAVGYPVLLSTAKNIAKGRVFDENFLMTLASLGAMVLGEVLEGVAVMLLYQLGELLQSIAVGSSRQSVVELMALKSERATRLVDGQTQEVTPEELQVGEVVLVKAGEKAPTDGVLLSERAVLDYKSLTGEAELCEVQEGAEVLSGGINAGAAYEMQVLRVYQDSRVGRILDLVENASAGKAEPEKFIARFAKYYTPVVCLLALALALFVPLLGGLVVEGKLCFWQLPRFVKSALTFLVISCPCALVISVPLTYFSGIGVCAKMGILVKGATYLDVLAQTSVLAFDKTGTLTEGDFTVRSVYAVQGEKEEVLQIATALERTSAHPIAAAFVGETPYVATEEEERIGRGLIGRIDGEQVLVGNEKLLAEEGIVVERVESVHSLVYVARSGKYLGYIEIGDRLRENAKEGVAALQGLGVRTLMWTGDTPKRAQAIANEVGMYEVNAGLLPDEKLQKAEEIKGTGVLTYIGDGINDAPVMMAADCAVSMGKLGSAAAVEASDIVLVKDDLSALPKAFKIAKKTRVIVFQNILFSLLMKGAFLLLGALGVLPLWLAVFADVGVMLLAVLNSFRVKK